MPRSITLTRIVLVVAGLLVLLAAATRIAGTVERFPWIFAALLGGSLAFIAVYHIGQTMGARAARRFGRAEDEGRQLAGMAVLMLALAVIFLLPRML